ncbi:MAG: hypothetical protein JWP35_3900 [Caulobacter sp.]|nr:hypothetical protein [Caulobacter sp.]
MEQTVDMPSGLDIAATTLAAPKHGRTMDHAVCKAALMTTMIMTIRPHGPGPARAS